MRISSWDLFFAVSARREEAQVLIVARSSESEEKEMVEEPMLQWLPDDVGSDQEIWLVQLPLEVCSAAFHVWPQACIQHMIMTIKL